jgi:hypothetical protein
LQAIIRQQHSWKDGAISLTREVVVLAIANASVQFAPRKPAAVRRHGKPGCGCLA